MKPRPSYHIFHDYNDGYSLSHVLMQLGIDHTVDKQETRIIIGFTLTKEDEKAVFDLWATWLSK